MKKHYNILYKKINKSKWIPKKTELLLSIRRNVNQKGALLNAKKLVQLTRLEKSVLMLKTQVR